MNQFDGIIILTQQRIHSFGPSFLETFYFCTRAQILLADIFRFFLPLVAMLYLLASCGKLKS